VRVALVEGARQVELGGGPLDIRDGHGRRVLAGVPTWARVVPRDRGFEVRGVRPAHVSATHLRITGLGGKAVRLDAREYGGALEIRPAPGGLLVVNEVGLEEYVAGAVKAEAGDRAPLEMLKAQAVVARTYAAYHRRLNAAKLYHLVATTSHQQYAGRVDAESPASVATRETEGLVLLWEGDLFPAFYHTDSGGHTEDPRLAFTASNMPALRPVRVDYPSDSPHQQWTLDLPLRELGVLLRKGGVAVGHPVALTVLERSPSLRVLRLEVRGTQGTTVLRGQEFRRLVGYDTLKSTLFAVAVDSRQARFAGRGYGHGAGMDQARARAMAERGLTAIEILAVYYRGAVLSVLR
jgi:stage II sporulation protein D